MYLCVYVCAYVCVYVCVRACVFEVCFFENKALDQVRKAKVYKRFERAAHSTVLQTYLEKGTHTSTKVSYLRIYTGALYACKKRPLSKKRPESALCMYTLTRILFSSFFLVW